MSKYKKIEIVLIDVRQILRSISIDRITNEVFKFDVFDDNIDLFKRLYSYSFDKRIGIFNIILKNGGVITGSKVLSQSYINNIKVLDRNCIYSDWDFLVTEENLETIKSKIEIKKYGDLSFHRIIPCDSYGDGGQDIDLIIVDKLPQTHIVDKYIYSDPFYIIEEKIKICSEKKSDSKKHINDLKDFIIKFKHLI